MTSGSRAAAGRANLPLVIGVAGMTTFGALPVFLLGGLAVLVRDDVPLSEARMGLTVAAFFAAAAIGSAPAGRIADRLGARLGLGAGLGGAVAALTLMAASRSWAHLTAGLALAGLSHAVLQVAANLLLTDAVPRDRQGVAFGIKQSAIPIATMSAGVALPVLGMTVGWRWAYAGAASLAAVALVLQQRMRVSAPSASKPTQPTTSQLSVPRRPLITLAVAVGAAAGAANAMAAFLVPFAVSRSVPAGRAGALLAVASGVGLLARVGVGWLADVYRTVDLGVVSAMLLAGAAAFATLPLADPGSAVLWLSAIVAFAAGWGWPGLLTFIVARQNPQAPGASTGITQAGIFGGAVLGPLAFGLLVSALSYAAAWVAGALAQLLGAVLITVVRRALPDAEVQLAERGTSGV